MEGEGNYEYYYPSTKEQVSDIMKFMSIGYYTNGDLNRRKIPRKRFVNIASKEGRERKVQKNAEEVISNIPEGFTIVVV